MWFYCSVMQPVVTIRNIHCFLGCEMFSSNLTTALNFLSRTHIGSVNLGLFECNGMIINKRINSGGRDVFLGVRIMYHEEMLSPVSFQFQLD